MFSRELTHAVEGSGDEKSLVIPKMSLRLKKCLKGRTQFLLQDLWEGGSTACELLQLSSHPYLMVPELVCHLIL